ARDIENIADGVFSPLEGFLGKDDLIFVLDQMRLTDDTPWTLPITLDVDLEISKRFEIGDDLLITFENKPLAVLHIEEKFDFEKKEIAEKVYGTVDPNHPGVKKTLELNDIFLSGKIDLINRPRSKFENYHLRPIETRLLFREKGWRTIVGFQTRNPPHMGHEYVQKTALAFVDGMFINPVIGRKKPGDFKDEVILKAYKELLKHYYLHDRAVMSILQTEMRYAGPREAIFHAIIRKNFGCTHFIVGRDHAGVGSYYKPFDAHDIFEEFPDLGITPVFFSSFFHCKKCGGVANEKTCPHENSRVHYSGTDIRKIIAEKRIPPANCMRPEIARVILESDEPFV
ncbi:MAG: sulfate adenylyltransferase, partial [Candidatus Hodarchaeales archaeon]